jgi:two-component system sensor histidine kinase TctE
MLILLLLSGFGTYYLAYKYSNVSFDHSLADSARDMALQVTVTDGRTTLNLPPAALQMFLTDEFDTIYFKVTDGARFVAGEPSFPAPYSEGGPGGPALMQSGIIKSMPVRIASLYYLPVRSPSVHPVLVQVAETLNKRKILARDIAAAMILPQLILVVLASFIVWLGVRKGLSSLHYLRQEITDRTYRDLSPLKENEAPIEVQPLMHAINTLMERLGCVLEEQRRFIADAAHQIRTPLSGLKILTDVALSQTDPSDAVRSLQQLSKSVNRMIHIVNQMLALAQVEPGAANLLDLYPLNILEFAKGITMEWVPRALEKNIDLGFEGSTEELTIRGDKVRLKMLLDNLLDNAIRYSPQGGCITTRLEKTDNIILSVEDEGQGIPSQERDLVLQRFYRILGNDSEGSGLGLSIVAEIAKSHGATIVIDEPKNHKGTIVMIIFQPV